MKNMKCKNVWLSEKTTKGKKYVCLMVDMNLLVLSHYSITSRKRFPDVHPIKKRTGQTKDFDCILQQNKVF